MQHRELTLDMSGHARYAYIALQASKTTLHAGHAVQSTTQPAWQRAARPAWSETISRMKQAVPRQRTATGMCMRDMHA
jgi:uncharacterized protein YukE